MKIKFFLLFVMTIPAYAQLNVSGFIGINPQANFTAEGNSYNTVAYSWRSGIIFGLGSEIFIFPSIALSPSVEYAYYPFDEYDERKEIRFDISSSISSTADPVKVWRLFLEAKFFGNLTTAIPIYLTTGFGLLSENNGAIHRTETYNYGNGPQIFSSTFKPKNSSFYVHTLGLGIRLRFLPYLSFDLNGHYLSNYNDRMYATVKCGLVYTVF
jgi:hypothetical protein